MTTRARQVAGLLCGLLAVSLAVGAPGDPAGPPAGGAVSAPAAAVPAQPGVAASQPQSRPESQPATQAQEDDLPKPPGYFDLPLGERYDTPAEVARLKNEALRRWMTSWLELRAEYTDVWRKQTGDDAYLRKLRSRMDALKMLVEDRAADLKSRGEPLE